MLPLSTHLFSHWSIPLSVSVDAGKKLGEVHAIVLALKLFSLPVSVFMLYKVI
jgi:hypothetical protein